MEQIKKESEEDNTKKGAYKPLNKKGFISPINQQNSSILFINDELRQFPIEQLQRGRYQPRREFTQEQLQELADSIRMQGIIQPIIVRAIANNRYEIIAGERRWRAAQLAGLIEVPCLIKLLTEEQATLFAIIENVQRADLNPIEEAMSYQKLYDDFGYKESEIAEKVGKNRSTVAHMMRLVTLEKRLQDYLIRGQLQIGHGKALASLPGALQLQLASQAVKNSWSVRELEKTIKNLEKPRQSSPTENANNANMARLERALSDHIGSQVNIEDKEGKGCLKINYDSLEVLEGIFQKMNFKYE